MSEIGKLLEEQVKKEFERKESAKGNPRFTTGQGALVLRASPLKLKETFMDEATKAVESRMKGQTNEQKFRERFGII